MTLLVSSIGELCLTPHLKANTQRHLKASSSLFLQAIHEVCVTTRTTQPLGDQVGKYHPPQRKRLLDWGILLMKVGNGVQSQQLIAIRTL